jgi:hypothetical protein
VTERLEHLLRSYQAGVAKLGDAEQTENLLELITVVAAATELMSALDRGDTAASEFHADVLVRHLAEVRPLRFWTD